MESARAVANAIIDRAGEFGVRDLSPMKLQKLVYFAHGWHLAILGTPLIADEVQAWRFGPVIYQLYRQFKEFGDKPIDRHAHTYEVRDGKIVCVDPALSPDSSAWELVDRILEVYGKYSAVQLSNMTHAPGTPWRTIRQQFDGELPTGVDIPNELIASYFKQQLAEAG